MSNKKARVHEQEEHWLLLTLPDGSHIKCCESRVAIGRAMCPGLLCDEHLILTRHHERATAFLCCHRHGTAKIDEMELKAETWTDVVGGKVRLHCGEAGRATVNASVLLGLPRNEFEWLDVLGIGSQAEVKRVRLLSSGETFAAKIYHKTKVMGHTKTIAQALAEDGRKEAEMLLSLRHPHIVSLHRIMESDRHLVLVLDLVNSGDLCDVINRGRLPHEQVRELFRQMADAVAFLHRHHVAHCDLKPSNFLVNREADGSLKLLLTDFATAAVFGRTHILHRVAFTPLYCAPELIQMPERFTNAVDVWSLGVCLFILQTDGEMPFETTEAIQSGTYDSGKIADPLARQLCEKMLVVDPLKRLLIDEVMVHPYVLILDEKLRLQLPHL